MSNTQADRLAEQIKAQAQVFASVWSLVGGRLDNGSMIDDANEAKAELCQMVDALAALAKQQASGAAQPTACPECGGSLTTWKCTCTPIWPGYASATPPSAPQAAGADAVSLLALKQWLIEKGWWNKLPMSWFKALEVAIEHPAPQVREQAALPEVVSIADVLRCRYPVCKTINPSGWGWDISRLNDVLAAQGTTPAAQEKK